MKKLTAGIFAGILTIVTVNAARADIATTNYVNQNVDAKVGALSGLETTAKNNTVAAINEVNTAAKAASTAATTAETNAKTYADGLNTAMDARVKANKDAIDVLNSDASVEGSVDYKITEATMDAISDVEAAKKDIEILKGNAEKVGSVDNKIKTAIDGLDGNVTGSGVVKTIKQENGVLTATLSAVAEADLDTALAGKINGKMNTTDYNTATTMAADGAYAKKANTVGANLTALDTQVKTNADAIAGLTSGANSVENQIDEKLGDLGEGNTTVGAALDKKLDKSDADVTGTHNYITAGTGVATNLTALDTQVKANANAIALKADQSALNTTNSNVSANKSIIDKLDGAVTVDGSVKKQIKDAIDGVNTAANALTERVATAEGDISALETKMTAAETNITNLTNNKANAADVYTKTEIDGKVTTINTSIDGKANVNKDLANKLLTTDATSGQLKDASTGLTQPAECGKNGVTCMLVNDGTGFKWEKIVDTYAAN